MTTSLFKADSREIKTDPSAPLTDERFSLAGPACSARDDNAIERCVFPKVPKCERSPPHGQRPVRGDPEPGAPGKFLSKCELGNLVSHPSRKNKDAARDGASISLCDDLRGECVVSHPLRIKHRQGWGNRFSR